MTASESESSHNDTDDDDTADFEQDVHVQKTACSLKEAFEHFFGGKYNIYIKCFIAFPTSPPFSKCN